MHIVVSIIFGLVLAGSVSAKESIQGHYDVVGNVPAAHSLKKVVYAILYSNFLLMMFLFCLSGRSTAQTRNTGGLQKILFSTLAGIWFPEQVSDDK